MTSDTYKNVLLVGGAGELGQHLLSALLADSTFNVTVLSRARSSSTFPPHTKVLKVDYSDQNALVQALTGQDVVISAIRLDGSASSFGCTLVEAAIQAGVRWMIPSEFVSDVSHPFYLSLPFAAPKVATIQLLKQNQLRIAHTFITTGTFLDWGFENGFLGFDIANRTVTFYDEGKNLVSGSTLSTVRKAIIAILHHPELTQNKRIYIADATFNQQQALTLFEQYTESKWTVKQMKTEDVLQQGAKAYSEGNIREGIYKYVMALIYNGQGAARFDDKISNQVLGLPSVPLDQIIQEVVERKKAVH